ncbi:sugar hydrolase [Lentzea sp. NBRC 105346]|uniref:beta-1,3-glucanase family protein n=1 Tax=Lentzea sp. NBRC 105346 TaxID=3032205 RepID=UPI0024A58652|nr:beta-1,3-glucanase family protein [Lentzea sp. NBRC 105346]GLZ31666.1 sugar hydrolase [Lentzea sp. NBRC 105346]
MRIILALVLALTGLSAPAQAAPSLLPLTVQNSSGRGDAVYLYVTGVMNGRLGYVNANGQFTAWSGGSIPPSPAPDVSIPGPGNGGSRTLQIPLGLAGGRLWMSFGQKIKFFLVPGGLVQPAPWAPGDPNRDILFDWSEFTYDNGGLWLNSSQVDMFSVPHAVEVTASNGTVKRTGQLVAGGRNRIFDQHLALGGDWARLVYNRLRVLNPSKGIDAGLFSGSYYSGYVSSAWSTYGAQTLTVVPYENQPTNRFTCRTSGGVLNCNNASGGFVASFQQPSTRDVFNCDGRLAAPNNDVGAISRSLCAALNRSTLGYLHTQPTTNASQFYTRSITNHYSKIIHSNMVDGKAYGFAFDDVGHFESLVHDPNPRSARVTLTSF